MKNIAPKFTFVLLAVLGMVSAYILYIEDKSKKENAFNERLLYNHNRAVNRFSAGVERMASLVAGMNTYINLSDELPDQKEFQRFVQNQLDNVHSTDSIAVTIADTNHIFKQAFTRNEIDPAGLVGKSVKSLRSQEKIEMLNKLMNTDELIMFPPINLAEGWLGIPINFRVHRNGEIEGYAAPILSFESIIAEVYREDVSQEFVFSFSTQRGYNFDRTRSYNGTVVYNPKQDPEYYQNFQVDKASYLYTTKNYYGFEITIGTAYKKPVSYTDSYVILLLSGYLFFIIGLFIISFQWHRYLGLNKKLALNNDLLGEQALVLKEKNEELVKLNRTKDRFFSIVGHDIKQPLSAIEGLIDLIRDKDISGDDLDEVLDMLRESVGNTAGLLNNLLRWGLSQTGDIKFNPTLFQLDEVVHSELDVLKERIRTKQIHVENATEGITVFADRDMLATILRNLISNSLKYTHADGKVSISGIETEKETKILIVDTGVGMSQIQSDNLFTFKNAQGQSESGTAGEQGTGLGLILCHEFVQRHKGTIDVNSTLQKGTTLTITFPKKTSK